MSEGEQSSIDRMLAIEAQDREFAKILQAKEKAKVKRAKERARQRKLDKQRKEAEASGGLVEVATVEHRTQSREGRISRGAEENYRPHSVISGDAVSLERDGRVSRGRMSRSRSGDGNDGRISRGHEEVRNSRSPELQLPSRKPFVHPEAIDNHRNDTYCKTPPKETSEPEYANLDETGKPIMSEPILHLQMTQGGEG